MSDGFVKLRRGEATWELLEDRNAFVLLTVIALRARRTHGWSRGEVTRFLNMLENAQQIVQQKGNVTTVITITNWKPHQETDGKQYSRRTPSGPQTDTNKNEKNEKKEKKTSCNAEALRLAELLFELIVQRKPDLRRPSLGRWARDMDRLIRLGGRTDP